MDYSKLTYRQLVDERLRLREEIKKVDFAMDEIETRVPQGEVIPKMLNEYPRRNNKHK